MWTLAFGLTLSAVSLAGAQVSPEHLFQKGNVAITITAGGAAFSPFQRAIEQPDTGALRFERRVSAGTTGAVGADVAWWLGRVVGVRAHASYMPSRFAVQHDRAGEDWMREQASGEQPRSYARLSVWAADVSALIRPPLSFGRVAPYAIVGAGVVSYRPQSSRRLPPEAEAAFTGGARTSPAGVVGVGAWVPLEKGDLLLSFAVTDHITRTPVESGEAGTWRDGPNRSSLYPDDTEGRVRLTSNVRLMVGLTIPLRSR